MDLSPIIRRVAKAHGVKTCNLLSRSRRPRFVRARHAAMVECFVAGESYSEIGRQFRRDPSSVLYAVRKARVLRVALPSGWIDWCEVSA
jgi:chromosomal replication initiation ATPase DnaA